MIDVTESEIIAAIQRAAEAPAENPGGALTREEIQDATGWSSGRVYKELRRLVKSGVVESVSVSRPNITGNLQPRPAYRMVGGDAN